MSVLSTLTGVLLLCSWPLKAEPLAPSPLTVWFAQPASDWEKEGLPIGNGAMGAVIMGGIGRDIVQFNEKTLWTGGPGAEGYDFGIPVQPRSAALASVRNTISESGAIAPEAAAALMGNKVTAYGDYQTFGDLVLDIAEDDSDVVNYKRELSLEEAQVKVSYQRAGVNYTREYFASYPDGIIAIKLSADKPGKISFTAGIATPENRTRKSSIEHGRLTATGKLNSNGLRYEAQMRVLNRGGQLAAIGQQKVAVTNADAVVILLAAGTDYAQQYPHYRGVNPHDLVQQRIDAAATKTFAQLQAAHRADYQSLFARVKLNIGQTFTAQPTPQLLAHYGKGNAALDRTLEATYFQFGRYLLIASSRAGSLPANLQGVWNNSTTPPWNADYHVNINLQMNYWMAETANLPELMAPYFDFVDSLVEPGKISAQKIAGVRKGWALFLNTNIWGFTGVIEWPTAFWQPEAAAWLAQHYYEHYLFSGDETFLRDRAYPIMKSAAEFWLEFLVKDPRDGKLIVSPSFSPEHGAFTNGAAMSQQIVFDLLRNTHEAAVQLGEKKFARNISKTLKQLDNGIRIGSWGQLQEWKEDLDDPKNEHRHISHLFALHPGHQIDAHKTPELLQAARISLNARGDGGTGWSQAWKVNMWARLLDGNRAHKVLGEQLQRSTLSNLWDNHPPFQIDGNFGAVAGIAEMLVQSHNNELHLLPALPAAWATGSVTGLRARGDVTLDMNWKDNQLTSARIHTGNTKKIEIRTPLLSGKFSLTAVPSGAAIALKRKGIKGSFKAQGGSTYLLSNSGR